MHRRDYLYDNTRWPLVRVTVPAEDPDAAGFARHLAAVDAVLARREPFAVVVDSAFQRAILGAILWLAPEPCPSRIFASLEEAESWAQSHLRHSAAA